MRRAAVVGWMLVLVAACGEPSRAPDASPDAVVPVDSGPFVQPPLPDLTPDPGEEPGCAATPPAAGTVRAKHVACDAELAAGPLAMGRVGDLLLENAHARFILRSGPESATTIGAPGGGLVDATPQAGPRIDALKEFLPTLNYNGLVVGPLVVVHASGTEAVVRAAFEPQPIGLIAATIPGVWPRPVVHGVIEYALRADDSALRMTLCALTNRPGTFPATVGAYAALGGANELVAPGTGVLDADAPSASTAMLLTESPALAYAMACDEGALTVTHLKTSNLISSARTTFEGLAVRCTTLRFATGSTESDAATALAIASAPQMLDVAVPPGGRAQITDPAGHVVLRSRETGGHVRFGVASGPFTTQVARAGGLFGDPAAPPAVGTLVVVPAVTGEPGAPVRITVRGLDGPMLETRFVAMAETRRPLPPGHYEISASRGTEYTLATLDTMVPPDVETRFEPTLDRVVDTHGYVATDFHLHSDLSTDSEHPIEDAVRQMAGEGLELVAGSDHDFVTDHPDIVRRTGVGDWLVAVAGEEVSTTRIGHFGGYPLQRDVAHAGAGAVPWFGLSPTQIFAALRARGTDVMVQVNHPNSGYFSAVMLDVATQTARADPAAVGLPPGTSLVDMGFDVLEVWNGYTRGGNEQSFADFLALRLAGRRFVMVGNSDTHRPDLPAGAPRSYVRVPDDARGRFGWADAQAGLRSGDVSVGAGLYLDVQTAEGARPGALVRPVAGHVTLHVRVQGPPWADCRRVRVYNGSAVVFDQPVATPRATVVRFEQDVVIDTPTDTLLSVRADGTDHADPVFPWAPFAVTNPMGVDANGDGH